MVFITSKNIDQQWEAWMDRIVISLLRNEVEQPSTWAEHRDSFKQFMAIARDGPVEDPTLHKDSAGNKARDPPLLQRLKSHSWWSVASIFKHKYSTEHARRMIARARSIPRPALQASPAAIPATPDSPLKKASTKSQKDDPTPSARALPKVADHNLHLTSDRHRGSERSGSSKPAKKHVSTMPKKGKSRAEDEDIDHSQDEDAASSKMDKQAAGSRSKVTSEKMQDADGVKAHEIDEYEAMEVDEREDNRGEHSDDSYESSSYEQSGNAGRLSKDRGNADSGRGSRGRGHGTDRFKETHVIEKEATAEAAADDDYDLELTDEEPPIIEKKKKASRKHSQRKSSTADPSGPQNSDLEEASRDFIMVPNPEACQNCVRRGTPEDCYRTFKKTETNLNKMKACFSCAERKRCCSLSSWQYNYNQNHAMNNDRVKKDNSDNEAMDYSQGLQQRRSAVRNKRLIGSDSDSDPNLMAFAQKKHKALQGVPGASVTVHISRRDNNSTREGYKRSENVDVEDASLANSDGLKVMKDYDPSGASFTIRAMYVLLQGNEEWRVQVDLNQPEETLNRMKNLEAAVDILKRGRDKDQDEISKLKAEIANLKQRMD